jgi:hypothetical protein
MTLSSIIRSQIDLDGAVMNSILAWLSIVGLVVIPFLTGIVFEHKLQPANRELGSRLLRY